MPDNRKPLQYGAFPVCRYYTVRAQLRHKASGTGRGCQDGQRPSWARFCQDNAGLLCSQPDRAATQCREPSGCMLNIKPSKAVKEEPKTLDLWAFSALTQIHEFCDGSNRQRNHIISACFGSVFSKEDSGESS